VLEVVKKHNTGHILKESMDQLLLRHEAQLRKFLNTKSCTSHALARAQKLIESKTL
jgi:hypothetical protein